MRRLLSIAMDDLLGCYLLAIVSLALFLILLSRYGRFLGNPWRNQA